MHKKITTNLSYILQFIDSARFMASSLSDLVNNLSEFIELNSNLGYCDWFLEYTNFQDDLIEYKSLCCILTQINRKLTAVFHDKTEYVMRIRNLKRALCEELFFRKAHRVIKKLSSQSR